MDSDWLSVWCFIVGQQLEKNNSESGPNDIVPYVFIVIVVV